MPKYVRTRATRSSSSNSDGLRDALLKQLERDGEKLLKRMMGDFSRTLEKETGRILGDVLGGTSGAGTARPQGDASGLQASLVSSAASLVSLLVAERNNRIRTQTSSSESRRSRETEQAFRVSRAQSMAEATQALARSERNQ